MDAVLSSETLIVTRWKWRQYFRPRSWYPLTGLQHNVASQKTERKGGAKFTVYTPKIGTHNFLNKKQSVCNLWTHRNDEYACMYVTVRSKRKVHTHSLLGRNAPCYRHTVCMPHPEHSSPEITQTVSTVERPVRIPNVARQTQWQGSLTARGLRLRRLRLCVSIYLQNSYPTYAIDTTNCVTS